MVAELNDKEKKLREKIESRLKMYKTIRVNRILCLARNNDLFYRDKRVLKSLEKFDRDDDSIINLEVEDEENLSGYVYRD